MEEIDDSEWTTFFDVLVRIVSGAGRHWKDRREEVRSQAMLENAEEALEEFGSWDWAVK